MHKYYTKVKCLRWNCKNIHPQLKKNNLLPSTGVDSKVSVEHHEFSVHVLELYKKILIKTKERVENITIIIIQFIVHCISILYLKYRWLDIAI
jgi:hypothetical protein